MWEISLRPELMLSWKILTCSDYFHLSLPALYKKPSIVILFLFFCHSTQTQIHRLKRWQANVNMLSSGKSSRSDCKKTHCKLLFKTWLKSANETIGLNFFLTPRMSVCAYTSKNANSHFSLLPLNTDDLYFYMCAVQSSEVHLTFIKLYFLLHSLHSRMNASLFQPSSWQALMAKIVSYPVEPFSLAVQIIVFFWSRNLTP